MLERIISIRVVLNLCIVLVGIEMLFLAFKMFCKLEPLASWLECKRTEKYMKLATSNEPNSIRRVSKECEGEFEIIYALLYNPSTPSDVIEFWITKGAWMYGLRQISFYGAMDENLRQYILCACVIHPNANQELLVKLANEIIYNERDYFIEHAYPEDDLYLISALMKLERLPKELRKKLSDYYSWRKVHGKTSTRCDEYGFIKSEYINW